MSFLNFLFVAFSLTSISFSQIITTDSIDGVKEQVAKADESTLVIFDCDSVLTIFNDAILRSENQNILGKCMKELGDRMNQLSKKDSGASQNLYDLKFAVMSFSKQRLVNEEMPDVVLDLQNRGIKTVVLTSMENKTLEKGSFIDLRINKLASFGFDFSKGWEDVKEMPLIDGQESPYYKSGIICSKPAKQSNSGSIRQETDKNEKSAALDSFLKRSKFKPNKIVFIDDSRNNLEDVKNWANKSQIEFVGVEYLEYKNLTLSENISNNLEKIAFVQLKHLVKNQKWLSDSEASELLESKKNCRG